MHRFSDILTQCALFHVTHGTLLVFSKEIFIETPANPMPILRHMALARKLLKPEELAVSALRKNTDAWSLGTQRPDTTVFYTYRVSSELGDTPYKEIQPFRLTLVLYRAARLGFRKTADSPILSERNVDTE